MNTETTPPEQFCANHPWRKTVLRCNRCGKAVCQACIVLTPVGYRCKQCIQEQQKVYENIKWLDYVITILISAFITGSLGLFMSTPSVCSVCIFLSPVVGVIIAEITSRIFHNRRGRYLRWAAAGGVVLGGLGATAISILLIMLSYFSDFYQDSSLWVFPIIIIAHTGLCLVGLWLWFVQLHSRKIIAF